MRSWQIASQLSDSCRKTGQLGKYQATFTFIARTEGGPERRTSVFSRIGVLNEARNGGPSASLRERHREAKSRTLLGTPPTTCQIAPFQHNCSKRRLSSLSDALLWQGHIMLDRAPAAFASSVVPGAVPFFFLAPTVRPVASRRPTPRSVPSPHPSPSLPIQSHRHGSCP